LKYPHKNCISKLLEGLIHVEINIKPCEGCHYCEENKRCIIEDDVQELYPKLKKADVTILSSPSYVGGVTSRLRAVMERTWHLRKGQLGGKIGTYIVVGRKKLVLR